MSNFLYVKARVRQAEAQGEFSCANFAIPDHGQGDNDIISEIRQLGFEVECLIEWERSEPRPKLYPAEWLDEEPEAPKASEDPFSGWGS